MQSDGLQSKHWYCFIFFNFESMLSSTTRQNKISNLSLLHDCGRRSIFVLMQGKNITEEIQFCHPYSIIKKNPDPVTVQIGSNKSLDLNCYGNPQSQVLIKSQGSQEESELDLESDYYISKPFKMIFERENQPVL